MFSWSEAYLVLVVVYSLAQILGKGCVSLVLVSGPGLVYFTESGLRVRVLFHSLVMVSVSRWVCFTGIVFKVRMPSFY